MEVAIVMVAIIAYVGFRQYLKHQGRVMVHRERLAAVEKGIAMPPVEQELRRSAFNVQRVLLLAGLCWLSIGISVFVVLSALLAHPSKFTEEIPNGMQWVGLAPAAIGLSHLIVYLAGKKREQ